MDPGQFGIDAFTKKGLYEIVEILAKLRKQPQVLADIEKYTTSCANWGEILAELLEEPRKLFVRAPGRQVRFEKIAQELHDGRAVLISMKLPNRTRGADHYFTLEPQGNGEVRVLHAWQDKHIVRPEDPMLIKDIMPFLKDLELELTPQNAERVEKAQRKVWGSGHDDPIEITEHSGRKKISYDTIISGKVNRPLQVRERLDGLGKELVGFSEEVSRLSFVSTESEGANVANPVSKVGVLKAAAGGAVLGAGLGFVFGAAGVLIMDKSEDRWKHAALEGGRGALGGGAGGAAGGVAAKVLTPTFSRLGVSVFRANAIAGVAMFGVFAAWDVTAWAKNNITAVELRKRFALNAGGAAGGVAGGIAGGAGTGALAGIWLGPVGVGVCSIIGGIAGGIAGGIGGAVGAQALDKAIWSEDEDSIMNSYEFFGWRSVERGTRPEMPAQEIVDAYMKKLKDKPKKVETKDWVTICTATMILLLRAMYPEFVELQKIAKNLQEKNSDGVAVIATTMLDLLLCHLEEESPE